MTRTAGLAPHEILSTPDLIAAAVTGDEIRRRRHGARTTFVRVFEVHVDAVPGAAPRDLAAGEMRIVGRPSSEEAALAAVRATAALAGGVTVSGFSMPDLVALAADGRAFAALCAGLRSSGLDAIADTPVDVTSALDLATALAVAREAGLAVERLTVHEQPASDAARLALVERAEALQAVVGGLLAFAPLPRSLSVTAPTTGYADIKLVALARAVVSGIPSIQVDWPLYGPKLAQVALTAGADDVDGVAAADSGVLGARRSPLEEIRTNIRAAALEPVERDGRFRPRP